VGVEEEEEGGGAVVRKMRGIKEEGGDETNNAICPCYSSTQTNQATRP
jgi:hypothetical protein